MSPKVSSAGVSLNRNWLRAIQDVGTLQDRLRTALLCHSDDRTTSSVVRMWRGNRRWPRRSGLSRRLAAQLTADLPVMPERIDHASHTPAVLLAYRVDLFCTSPHRLRQDGIRIGDDQKHLD
jgi:hypothetical protein